LILDHNQYLDLAFLPTLASSCPQLQVLKMDLKYFSADSQFSYHHSDPKYETLLLPGEIPTWPASLRVLELEQLRNWSVESAETFFRSLLDSAAALPNLRRLVLKAILKIGWRDRATFRDEWIGRFRRVFLRKDNPPSPHFRSLLDFRQYKARVLKQVPENSELDKVADEDSDAPIMSQRRSTRIARLEEASALSSSNSQDEPSRGRRRRHRHARVDESGSSASSDETDSNADSEIESSFKGDWRKKKETAIQGMCETVNLRIDNLRPAEEQFNENDFLDSEASGDEDWDGTDRLPGEERYAW